MSPNIITPIELVEDFIEDRSGQPRKHTDRGHYLGQLLNEWTNGYFGVIHTDPDYVTPTDLEYAVVLGEQGIPNFAIALDLLTNRATLHPMRAWMLAETVAAGVVAAQEISTDQVLEPEAQERLAQALTNFGLR